MGLEENVEVKFEHDKFLAISSLEPDILFEYEVSEDIMCIRMKSEELYSPGIIIHDFSSAVFDMGIVAREDEPALQKFNKELQGNQQKLRSELRLLSKSSQTYEWCKVEGIRVTSQDGRLNCVVGKIADINCQKNREIEQQDKQVRDPLTKLYNKDESIKKIEEAINSRQTKEIQAVFIVDINNFSEINDTMGSIFGNEVLRNVSMDIKKSFANENIVGRVGVDKFIAMMKDAGSLEAVKNQAEKLREVFNATYTGENDRRIDGSIGIAICPLDGNAFETLFEKADKAMVYARNHNDNFYELYQPQKETEYAAGYRGREEKKEGIPVIRNYFGGSDSLIELAFKLIEETSDVDSAINMLIRRIARGMNLSAVCVAEITEEPHTIQYMYEWSKDGKYSLTGTKRTFTKPFWDSMMDTYRNSKWMCVVDNENSYEGPKETAMELEKAGVKALVQCAFSENKEYIGRMDFVDYLKDRVWTDEEINTMRILTNIVFSYMLKMRAFEAAKAQVERITAYDQVTGLLKYEKFKTMAENILRTGEDGIYCVVCSDIYNFKYINEKYGYVEGDKILKKFAEFLVGKNDHVMGSRIASDNFVSFSNLKVAMTPAGINGFTAFIAEKNKTFAEALRKEYPESNITISSGICVFISSKTSLMDAVSYANLARKKAKMPGNPSCMLYHAEMSEEVMQQAAYLNDVKAALEKKEFIVHFQPKVNAVNGRIVGAEALVRWKHADGTMTFPGDFVPVLEQHKLIRELDFYVYEEVFRYLRERLDAGRSIVPISVNASRVHLTEKSEMKNYLSMLIEKYQIPPEYIEVEMTENIFINDIANTVEVIESIRNMGIKVSMDDFGSGYSSLNLLKKIPIDILKLDKEFVDDIECGCTEDVVISSVINMSKKMGLQVVCEGVETKQQAELIVRSGCSVIQGYYFSRPVDEEIFGKMLDAVRIQ